MNDPQAVQEFTLRNLRQSHIRHIRCPKMTTKDLKPAVLATALALRQTPDAITARDVEVWTPAIRARSE
jgi:hypothetical protein